MAETGNRAQPAFQLVDHRLVARGLPCRGKRVQLRKTGPGDRDHLAGGIELHGAGTQRDHRLVQRQVLVLQLFEVAQHFGFAVVLIEHRVREERCAPHQVGRDAFRQGQLVEGGNFQAVIHPRENVEQAQHRLFVAGFVQAHAQVPTAEDPQVDLRSFGAFDDGRLGPANIQGKGIEKVLVEALDAFDLKPCRQDKGQPMHTLGDALKTFRAVVHRIEAGNVGQQHLGSANVGIGLLAADMLLAGLQGHA